MDNFNKYDVAIIGAGIGGYVSAIRASQLGKSVALIEKDEIGGTCLNWGCIPMKTMLSTTVLLHKIESCEELGISLKDVKVNVNQMISRKESVVDKFVRGVQFLVKKNNISILKGKGKIKDKNTILVTKENGLIEEIIAENIVIASGIEFITPTFIKNYEKYMFTSREALCIKKIPSSIVILGEGPIGVEFVSFFSMLGAKTYFVIDSNRVFPTLDGDLDKYAQRILKRRGINIIAESKVASVNLNGKEKLTININTKNGDQQIEAEKILILNMNPKIPDLGLENIGIKLENGFIKVDEHMRTNIPGIYAIGDVVGGNRLAHKAVKEGIVASENIAGKSSSINYILIPTCVYTSPEIASVGLSEEDAIRQGYSVAVGRFPFLANGRALTLGEKDGFVKIICNKETDEILGVHIMAERATDMIGEASLAIHLECTSEELGKVPHPHPTLSEAVMEAAQSVSDSAIHI